MPASGVVEVVAASPSQRDADPVRRRDPVEASVHPVDQLAGGVQLVGDLLGDEALQQVAQCLILLGREQAGQPA